MSKTKSVSAGLDYPAVGPEHAFLKDSGRAVYLPVTDKQALEAFFEVSKTEGIIPALEPSHALYQVGALKLQGRCHDSYIYQILNCPQRVCK